MRCFGTLQKSRGPRKVVEEITRASSAVVEVAKSLKSDCHCYKAPACLVYLQLKTLSPGVLRSDRCRAVLSLLCLVVGMRPIGWSEASLQGCSTTAEREGRRMDQIGTPGCPCFQGALGDAEAGFWSVPVPQL